MKRSANDAKKKRAHAKAVLEVHHKRHDLIEQAKLEQHQRHLELMRDLKNVKPEE